MEFRVLRQNELEQWYDHCGEVFANTGRDYFVRHYVNDPQSHLEDIFVAVDGERIAATVRVFRRKVYIGGRAVKMGGIGEVSTKAEYRRQGLSGKLLQMAIAHMEALDMPISMLFTGSFGHYARYGWFQKQRETVTIKLAQEPLPEGFAVREAGVGDIPMLRALYDLYAPRFNGAVVRDDQAYWERWIWGELAVSKAFVLTKDGNPQAYLHIGKPREKDGVSFFPVREFAAAPDAEGLLPQFLKTAAELAGCPMIARMPGPLWTFENVEGRDTDPSMMLRLNRPFTVDSLIDSDEKLAAACDKALFFGADGF